MIVAHRQLPTFVAVAETLNVSAGAKKLGVTQTGAKCSSDLIPWGNIPGSGERISQLEAALDGFSMKRRDPDDGAALAQPTRQTPARQTGGPLPENRSMLSVSSTSSPVSSGPTTSARCRALETSLQTVWNCRWSAPPKQAVAGRERRVFVCVRTGHERGVSQCECETCPEWIYE
jgi:hypothetical protein